MCISVTQRGAVKGTVPFELPDASRTLKEQTANAQNVCRNKNRNPLAFPHVAGGRFDNGLSAQGDSFFL